MAVGGTLLTAFESATPGTSFATASVSVNANELILVSVELFASTVTGISGAGLTFTEVANNTTNHSLWRALGGAGSGAITITTAASSNGCVAHVTQHSGVDTGGTNGSAAIVQAVTSTTAAVTLAAFADAGNGALASFGIRRASATTRTGTPDTGWTELADNDISYSSTTRALETQFRADNDTTAAVTWSGTGEVYGGIAVEIKVAAGGGTANPWYYYAQC